MKKQGIRTYCILFGIYWLLVFSPFLIPALNSLTPTFCSMPFTFWYTHLVIILGCILISFGSKKMWNSYDKSVAEYDSKTMEDGKENVR